jgi:hypothetical protein
MRKLLLGAIAAMAIATPSHAFYTECIVQKDTVTMNRPGGDYGDPRWTPLEKGEKVAIRSVYNSKTKKEGSKPYDWVGFLLRIGIRVRINNGDGFPPMFWPTVNRWREHHDPSLPRDGSEIDLITNKHCLTNKRLLGSHFFHRKTKYNEHNSKLRMVQLWRTDQDAASTP